MSLRQVDHNLYREYKNELNPEPFQEYFIKWYEAGGVTRERFTEKLQILLVQLREKYTWDEICSRTSLVSRKSLITHSTALTIGEEKSKKIYMNLKERL